MGYTNFPNGLTSFGVPVLTGMPQPFTGNYWFVAPHSGLDGNSGKNPQAPLKTLARALALATANNNDVVFLIAESNTAANTTDYQSVTLDWNKDLTHLIGISAPSKWSNRARIAQLSTATGVSPLFKLSANGCYIANVGIFQGVADATSLIAMQVTGEHNVIDTCAIQGIGNATQVTAGAMDLQLYGAAENLFTNCLIGTDTISRDQNCTGINAVVNATPTASTRNYFRDCQMDAYLSNAGYAAVTIGAVGIDRELVFERSMFWAKSTNKAISQTSVFSIPAISQGAILLKDTSAFTDGGTAVWDSNSRGIIWNNAPTTAATAGGNLMTNK